MYSSHVSVWLSPTAWSAGRSCSIVKEATVPRLLCSCDYQGIPKLQIWWLEILIFGFYVVKESSSSSLDHGIESYCALQDQKLAEKLTELKSAGSPWVGTFLLKDQNPRTDGSQVLTTAEGGEGTEVLRGEELFKRLHEHGTFAQVDTINSVISAKFDWSCCRWPEHSSVMLPWSQIVMDL